MHLLQLHPGPHLVNVSGSVGAGAPSMRPKRSGWRRWPRAVALDIVRRPKATPIHELERYMRCKDCSQVRGYPYKRSHLVALRPTKISAKDPASTWWPGKRD